MTITVQLESMEECLPESYPLQVGHWEEREGWRGQPMKLDYAERIACERAGKYVYATARDEDQRLVGHCGWFVRYSLLTSTPYGFEEVIYLLPTARLPNVASALWKITEAELIRRGVRDLRSNIPNDPVLVRVWRRWGYAPTTINMSRFVTEEEANEILA